jgi:hypothetical protein
MNGLHQVKQLQRSLDDLWADFRQAGPLADEVTAGRRSNAALDAEALARLREQVCCKAPVAHKLSLSFLHSRLDQVYSFDQKNYLIIKQQFQ